VRFRTDEPVGGTTLPIQGSDPESA